MAKKRNVKDVEAEEVKDIRKGRKIKREDEVEVEDIETEEVDVEDEVDVKEEKAKKEEKNKKEGYFAGVKKELKKVRWAKGSEVFKNSIAVIIFVLIFVGFFELVYLVGGYLTELLKGWL